ncbi:MAG TPA: Do family serine endopeptidase [Ignavibacteria bacterium]|nr:Do family serine endopeptidase [Ignavibacteria bacterium]
MIKLKSIIGATALVVLGIIMGALLVSGFGVVRPSFADINIGTKTAPVTLDANASSFSKAFIEVAAKVTPEIVQIEVVSNRKDNPHGNFTIPFDPFNRLPKEQKGSGSGIIISPDGYIVTNNHVVKNAIKVTVGLSDKRTFTAKVVGTDPLTDLAVIKIKAKKLPTAFLGNSDGIKVGQWVMAIGNPLSLSSTVTAGIISAIGRGQLGLIKDRYGIENYIQTDAAINPGNSGGALVDLSGAVIGINSAIAASGNGTYIGYGFAIPINLVKAVAKELIANGKVTRGYIGIEISEVDDALAKSIGLDEPKGILVQKLVKGGSAAKAGIKEGDVILKIDSKVVNRPNELQTYIATKTAGTKVQLTLFRDGKTITKNVKLKPRNDRTEIKTVRNSNNSDESNDGNPTEITFDKIGLTVQNLSKEDKDTFNVNAGILITNVKRYGIAGDQNLSRGLIIVEADKKKIRNVKQFKRILESKKGSALLLKVEDQKGNTRLLGLDVPGK